MISYQQAWKFTLPDDYQGINVWKTCLKHGIAASNIKDDLARNLQLQYLKTFVREDWIIAYLRNKTIGGIGRVIVPYNYNAASEKQKGLDYFQGEFWHRIGVKWVSVSINIDVLSRPSQNPFRAPPTILKISNTVLDEILHNINPKKMNPLLNL